MAMNLSISSLFPTHSELSQDTTYVALAAMLLPPELQMQASAAGLCHVQFTGYTVADQHCIQVAALPHRFDEAASSRRVFTVWVDAEQLASILPWDRSLQSLPTCEVRERLQLHPQHEVPVRNELHLEDRTARPHPQEPQEQADHLADHPQETITLLPLPELFVSSQTVQETVAETPNSSSRTGSVSGRLCWTRLTWLHAALAMVRRQMSHAHQTFAKLDTMLENVIATQRHLRHSLVSASAVYVGQRLVGWRLQIAYPVREVLA